GARFAVLCLERDGAAQVQRSAIQVRDTSRGQVLRSIELPRGDIPLDLAFSPDGSRIAAHSSVRPAILVWDAESGGLRFELRRASPSVKLVRFRSDGSRLIASGYGTLQEWDVPADRDRSGATPGGPKLPDTGPLVLSADGTRLAGLAPGADGRVVE